MDIEEESDEVLAEYPLYSASIGALFSEGDIRLVHLQYPLRPSWRGYDTDNTKEVSYKPKHCLLNVTVPEDQPAGKADRSIYLSGQGLQPEVPLCALCKVDGAMVMMPISEVTTMRPDMSRVATDEKDRMDAVRATTTDSDYAPQSDPATKAGKTGKSAAKAGKSATKAVNVEVQKRENERQAAARARSYTHLREQTEKEEAKSLTPHGLIAGQVMLKSACQKLMQSFPAEVAMGVPAREYLRIISPATYCSQAGAASNASQSDGSEKTANLDPAALPAVKQALEALFQEQSVVTMGDVRVWLASFPAAPKAALAAKLKDSALSSLLMGGGSILCIRGRYVLKPPPSDAFRTLLLKLVETSASGVRKAEVMQEAQAKGIKVTEHEYGRVLRDLCTARGALWDLKAGASFKGGGGL